jgi:hypothetical protein
VKRSAPSILFALVALATSLLSGCAAMLRVTEYKSGLPKVLKDDRFAITFRQDSPPHSGQDAEDYYMDVTVENVSAADQMFDTGDIELKDVGTGMSYFSISKSKDVVSIPSWKGPIITKVELKSGQKTEGRLWFVAPPGKAKADKLELKLGQAVVMLEK